MVIILWVLFLGTSANILVNQLIKKSNR